MQRASLLALFALALATALPAPARAQCSPAADVVAEGDAARKAGDVEGALAKYRRAAELAPENAGIQWKLALAYQSKEDWARMAESSGKAAALAEKAEGKRTHADYSFSEGYALEQLAEQGSGTWKAAEEPLRAAIAIDPRHDQAHGELAWVLVHLDDEAGALQHWTKAVALRPDDTRYAVSLADAYRRLMLFAEEERVLATGIAFAKAGDEHLFDLHTMMGDVREKKNDFPGAVKEHEAALAACAADACSAHPEAFFDLGAAYAELEPPRKREAVEELQRFWKVTRSGGKAQKYADLRDQAQELARRLGGSLE